MANLRLRPLHHLPLLDSFVGMLDLKLGACTSSALFAAAAAAADTRVALHTQARA